MDTYYSIITRDDLINCIDATNHIDNLGISGYKIMEELFHQIKVSELSPLLYYQLRKQFLHEMFKAYTNLFINLIQKHDILTANYQCPGFSIYRDIKRI